MDERTELESTWRAGQRLGAYRLLERIGTGGMGEVWLAEQAEPIRRKVAIKIIKAGMDTANVIARFEAERQALALMDHPCIAKVFEAGSTPQGRPYFVMEYVDGAPITEYCDRHRLGTAERLELFAQVCDGAQHAHNKAVIHRDLKPSNVLVTEVDGHPTLKIIDFGVAKATAKRLTDQPMATEFGQLIGTPAYMSPEQAQLTGEDVDTRTDVYALGMILYELLVGVLPFELREPGVGPFEDFRRVILETDSPRPSTRIQTLGERSKQVAVVRQTDCDRLVAQLRGDLDWIVVKAIEKERGRRYDTVQSLREDIERFLRDEPVLARPPSTRYRASKFIRRNRAAVIGAVSVSLVLVLGAAASTWGFLRARRAEKTAAAEAVEAKRQAAIAEAMNKFLNEDLLASVAPSAQRGRGRDVLMRDVLDAATKRIETAAKPGGSLGEDPFVESSIRMTLGRTYRDLGEYDVAESQFRRAVDLRRRLPEAQMEYGSSVGELGVLASSRGHYAAAESLLRLAVHIYGDAHADTVRHLFPAITNLAQVFERQTRYGEAESLYVPMLEQLRRMVGNENTLTLMVMSSLGSVYHLVGRFAEAESLKTSVFTIRRRIDGEEAPITLRAMNNLATTYASQGHLDKAQDLFLRTLEIKRRVFGPEHPSTMNTLSSLASLLDTRGEHAEAEARHREALAICGRVLGADHPLPQSIRAALAFSMSKQGRSRVALDLAAKTAAICRETLGDNHETTLNAMLVVAMCHEDLGRLSEAESMLRRVVAGIEARDATDPLLRAHAEAHLGLVLGKLGWRDEAETILQGSLTRLPVWEAEARSILRAATALYDAWNVAYPAGNYDERAGELRERLL